MSNAAEQNERSSAFAVKSHQSSVLSEIYNPDTQIVIWTGQMSDEVRLYAETFQSLTSSRSLRQLLSPEDMRSYLDGVLHQGQGRDAFIDSISTLAEMYCYLFDLKSLGFRMHHLDRAMCPKFHRDHVPCRLVMTLRGAATQWRSDDANTSDDFESLQPGDIALLKGSGWFGNEDKGLVHRSPELQADDWRLFLSMDFAN
jgi:hypothetical protein